MCFRVLELKVIRSALIDFDDQNEYLASVGFFEVKNLLK